MVLVKLASLLPLGELGFRVNLLSGLCAAAAVWSLCRLVLAVAGDDLAALVGAAGAGAALALSLTFFRQATVAEVYAPTAALLAAALLLFHRVAAGGGARDGLMLAVVCGLGLAVHVSFALIGVPVVVLLLVRLYRGARWVLAAPLLVVAVTGGLYLYLPVRAAAAPDPSLQWSQADRAGAFLDQVTGAGIRAAYAGEMKSSEGLVWHQNARAFFGEVGEELLLVLLAAILWRGLAAPPPPHPLGRRRAAGGGRGRRHLLGLDQPDGPGRPAERRAVRAGGVRRRRGRAGAAGSRLRPRVAAGRRGAGGDHGGAGGDGHPGRRRHGRAQRRPAAGVRPGLPRRDPASRHRHGDQRLDLGRADLPDRDRRRASRRHGDRAPAQQRALAGAPAARPGQPRRPRSVGDRRQPADDLGDRCRAAAARLSDRPRRAARAPGAGRRRGLAARRRSRGGQAGAAVRSPVGARRVGAADAQPHAVGHRPHRAAAQRSGRRRAGPRRRGARSTRATSARWSTAAPSPQLAAIWPPPSASPSEPWPRSRTW